MLFHLLPGAPLGHEGFGEEVVEGYDLLEHTELSNNLLDTQVSQGGM